MPEFDICPDWVRPCEWPLLPDIATEEEKVVGLVAVEDTDSEFLAVLCEGDYVVDWGDGSEPELVLAEVRAEHQYIYAEVPGEPVCASPSSSDYDGYKVVIVTITPQMASSEGTPALTKIDLQQRHSAVGDNNSHLAKWLELDLNVQNCAELIIGPEINNPTDGIMYLTTWYCAHISWLQHFTLRRNSLTSLSRLFSYCSGLKKVEIDNSGSVTNTSDMFFRCSSMVKVDLFDTSSVTNMSRMFAYCYALKCVPQFVTSAATDISKLFLSCSCLPTIPLLDTSAATNAESVFELCESLRELPLLDFSSVTSLKRAFYGCVSLRELPALDTSNVTTLRQAFAICEMLRKIPDLDTSGVTDMNNLFYACLSLSKVPAFDCSAVSSTTNASQMFLYFNGFTRCLMHGIRYSHTYAVLKKPLTASALNEIFTNLGTAAGSQTITITGCLGAATCDKTIATAKGWTVTG